jgi:hypothetical protein
MNAEYSPVEKEKALDDFEMFLFHMDDLLESFVGRAEQQGIILDYSIDSLDKLQVIASDVMAKPQSDFHGNASKYLGEVVRKNFGGKWVLSLDMKENSLYYGKPVLIGFSKHDTQFSPYSVMRSVLLRPNRSLKEIVLYSVNPVPLDLSHLPTEGPADD